MKINIKAQNTSVTSAISDYVDKRMGSLGKFIGEHEADSTLYVQIGKTSKHHHAGDNVFSTEVNLDAGTTHLRAEAFDADLYASIDKVRDELVRELTTAKKKRITLFRKGGQKIKNIIRGFSDR